MKKNFLRGLLYASILICTNQIYAQESLVCKETTSIHDTMKLTIDDPKRPLKVTKTTKSFNVFWSGNSSYTNMYWQVKFDVVDPSQVNMAIRKIQYDDNIEIKVNGNTVFKRNGGGVGAFDLNQIINNHFVKGENTLDLHLRNNQSVGKINVNFEFSEGGCSAVPFPRPIIPNLPDSTRCIESLICTEGAETRNISGVNVTRECWNWETKRTCFDFREDRNQCAETPVDGASCEVVSRECVEEKEFTINGQVFNGCVRYETQTRCTKPVDINSMTEQERADFDKENARRRMLCKPVQTCVGDDCYIKNDERDKPDEDMPFVLALLELGRQAGTYFDPANMRLFSGVDSRCRSMRGFGAMAGCCEVKDPVATDSKGQQVKPTNANTFNNLYENVDKKFSDPNTSYQEEYVHTGSSPYVYDPLYKPNEAAYMLQGTGAMKDTNAGTQGLAMGGASTVTVMGYGWSDSGTSTGDQQSFGSYSGVPNTATPDD